MRSMDYYTVSIYIVVFLSIFLLRHTGNFFDIYKRMTLRNFIKVICLIDVEGSGFVS